MFCSPQQNDYSVSSALTQFQQKGVTLYPARVHFDDLERSISDHIKFEHEEHSLIAKIPLKSQDGILYLIFARGIGKSRKKLQKLN